jgi:uncharacterized iron-regulated membrane protein
MSKFTHRLRRAVFLAHLWVGLTVGLWFVVMGLTGSVMAWHDPMVSWEFARRTPPRAGAIIAPSRAVAAVRAAHPDLTASEVAFFIPPSRMFAPYVFFRVTPNPMHSRFYLIDARTGAELPSFRISDTVTGIVEYIHIALLDPTYGEQLNGVLAIVMLPLLISGIWLWWPPTLRQLRARLSIKRGSPPKRLLYDLHNVLGMYGLPLLAILTVTTVVLVAESKFHEPLTTAARGATDDAAIAPPAVTPRGKVLPLDTLMAAAYAAVPNGVPLLVASPLKPEAPFQVTFRSESGRGLFPNLDIYLDPYTGTVLRVDDAAKAPALVKLVASSTPLHAGNWGGLLSRLLYTFAGLIPLGLYVTGFMRWRRRNAGKRDALMRAAAREAAAMAR